MTLEEMKQRKKELGYSNERIAALSGVPLGTVMKVFGGATKAPRRGTIRAIERVLAPQSSDYKPGKGSAYYDLPETDETAPAGKVKEAQPDYGHRQDGQAGRYGMADHTLEDYYALPSEKRVELISGVFYDMAAPSVNHQLILGELAMQFRKCQREHSDTCRILFAPCDVQLFQDDRTIVQPDLMVVCDPDQLREKVLWGAPDLTLEVMSPASRSHDSLLKLNKYREAGVREYWLVDPEYQKVFVYEFDGNGGKDSFRIYTFNDNVPVGISGGRCRIDFRDVKLAMI